MRKMIILLSAFFITIASQGALAQTTYYHTWVSNSGSDSSATCDIAAPCVSFNAAYNKTTAGGEITCLNGGNYGGATVIKSITINCEAAIGSSAQAPGIYSLNIGTAATDIVTLRGLDLDGAAIVSTVDGLIHFYGAGTLRLEKMRVSNLHGAANGVHFAPTGAAKLQVVDSIIANNGSSALASGIYIKPASGITANVTIEHSYIENNNFGIFADASGGGVIKGVVRDSFVTGNINNGISISSSGALAVLIIDNTLIANNGYGLVVGGAASALMVRHSTVVNNGTGLYTSGGGNLYSYRDNSVNFNTVGGDGAFTQFLSLQ